MSLAVHSQMVICCFLPRVQHSGLTIQHLLTVNPSWRGEVAQDLPEPVRIQELDGRNDFCIDNSGGVSEAAMLWVKWVLSPYIVNEELLGSSAIVNRDELGEKNGTSLMVHRDILHY